MKSSFHNLENIMKNQCINIHAESLDLKNKSDYVKVGESPEQFFLISVLQKNEGKKLTNVLCNEGIKWFK